jgi:hypothetical protein
MLKNKESIMKNFKSTSALFMLLLVPCTMFGSISEIATSVVNLPVNFVKSVASLATGTVKGLADVERSIVTTVTSPFLSGGKKAVNFVEDHSDKVWNLMSVATLAVAGYYAKKAYTKSCPMACKKSVKSCNS